MSAKLEAENGHRSLTAGRRSLRTVEPSSWAGRLAESSRTEGTALVTARTVFVGAAPPGAGRETEAVRRGTAAAGIDGFR
jgi:hypothetical protein